MAAGAIVGNRNWAESNGSDLYDRPPIDQPSNSNTVGPSFNAPRDYSVHESTPGTLNQTAPAIPTPVAPIDTGTAAPGAVMPTTPQAASLAALSAGSGTPPPTTPAPASSAPLMLESAPQSNVGMRMPPSLATLLKASIY